MLGMKVFLKCVETLQGDRAMSKDTGELIIKILLSTYFELYLEFGCCTKCPAFSEPVTYVDKYHVY